MLLRSSDKRICLRVNPLLLSLLLLVALVSSSQAGLKIYYIRHAEGGHNVVKQYANVPKDQWPDYVGNGDVFTPKGKTQVAAATEKLKKYKFDFIAASPMWRTRNTVLPYLRATGQKAEIWPELHEFSGRADVLSKDLPQVKREKILEAGAAVEIPENERDTFYVRKGARKDYKLPEAKGAKRDAAIRLVSDEVIKLIKERFGGSDKAILLTGHGNSGKALLKTLLQDNLEDTVGMANTGIWMVEEQADGSFELKIYNDEPYKAKALAAANH